MAETWVCSYLMNDEIQTSTFKRLSDKEFKTSGGYMDKYLRVKGVAEMLSVSTSTVWNYVKQDTNFPKSIKLTGSVTLWSANEME